MLFVLERVYGVLILIVFNDAPTLTEAELGGYPHGGLRRFRLR
jgi:hypothetical protein